ncbi:protein kinase superfamily protein [Actinidia rufa]|uniref:Protein kinase superfamily protein n=1 Tax=Actinidia rufa TaxID=165716 RepID=A0A7J0EMX2_9ERIC|nr:protein kinase superfamily protein [Actinidia rufa]
MNGSDSIDFILNFLITAVLLFFSRFLDLFSGTPNGGGVGLSARSSRHGEILATPNLKVYSFSDLNIATSGFDRDMILGAGGFGTVYKGQFKSGMNVAIKKLNPQSKQGLDEWQNMFVSMVPIDLITWFLQLQVDKVRRKWIFLGRLSHPNLVKLLGYCLEDQELLLVYEFLEGGSLENHLFRLGGSATDSWDLRLKIAIDSAKCLTFLHTLEEQVIYRDFKASNILLDESDVYSFGVLLLEMMSGLRVLDNKRRQEQRNLINWAKPLLNKKKLKLVMDARIEGQYSSEAATSVAKLTLQCLDKKHKKRPSMEKVVAILENINTMKVKTE